MKEQIHNILKEYSKLDFSNLSTSPSQFSSQTWFEIANKILQSINIEDLYIEPKIDIIAKLKFYREQKNKKKLGYQLQSLPPNIYLNEKYIEKICKNIKLFSFNSYYPTLIIKLIDNNILSINNMEYYTIFKYIFSNKEYFKNKESYIVAKVFINYFYGILGSDKITQIYSKNFENFEKYKYLITNYIKNYLKNDLIYFDTDCFYYFDKNYKFNFEIPHEIENVKDFIIFRKKKYIELIDNNLHYHGFK